MGELFGGKMGGPHERSSHGEVNYMVYLHLKLVLWQPHLMLSDLSHQTSYLRSSLSILISL